MKRLINLVVAVVAAVIFFSNVPPAVAEGKNVIYQLSGLGSPDTREVPRLDGSTSIADCYDVQLRDPEKDMVIGTASDCLTEVVATDTPFGTAIALTDITFFNLNNGTFVAEERVTVSPLTDPDSGLTDPPRTHITGSINPPGVHNIIASEGTKRFAGRTGTVRLSGAVAIFENGDIDFDCFFHVQLEDDDDD